MAEFPFWRPRGGGLMRHGASRRGEATWPQGLAADHHLGKILKSRICKSTFPPNIGILPWSISYHLRGALVLSASLFAGLACWACFCSYFSSLFFLLLTWGWGSDIVFKLLEYFWHLIEYVNHIDVLITWRSDVSDPKICPDLTWGSESIGVIYWFHAAGKQGGWRFSRTNCKQAESWWSWPREPLWSRVRKCCYDGWGSPWHSMVNHGYQSKGCPHSIHQSFP